MPYTNKEELEQKISVLQQQLAKTEKAKTGWMVGFIIAAAVAVIAAGIAMA